MNILHINCNYLHTPLYSEMISRLNVFHENTIVMPRKIHETYPISENVKYGTEFLINDKIFNKSDRFLYFKKQKKIKKWLNSNSVDFNNFDIIHAHTLFSDGYWAYKSGKPYIITVRNTDLNYFMKYYKHLRHIGKKILRNSSKIIFLSKMYEERTINELFKSKERQSIFNKSVVIPNGINDFWIKNSLTKQHNEEPKTNIVFTGKILKNKNLKLVTSALKTTGDNYKLYVIGKIDDISYFDQAKDDFDFTYLGEKDKSEIVEIYKEMDIFVLPSFHETFGLVYLEALTQGLPIIYTRNEGIDNYFEEGKVGYSVDPKSITSFVDSLINIDKNYEYIINNINKIDKNKFSWDMNVERHLEIYEESLQKRI
ncbi:MULTISPECIES: glycosyltransferase family 4 protein [Mammaliicoccus]|nr:MULTISPECIES: glycosyltransferase family 4 protein [Mammaliicoccus]MEB7725163.1 glycosyltransferase family 4 protein [Mammaliicoccus fleurettii]HCN61647.1 hypothetical protein [Staphylococcus sp.]